jgi:hypothetical protein
VVLEIPLVIRFLKYSAGFARVEVSTAALLRIGLLGYDAV